MGERELYIGLAIGFFLTSAGRWLRDRQQARAKTSRRRKNRLGSRRGVQAPLGNTKNELLDIRAAILDALALLETLRRGPDGEHGNGGHDRERIENKRWPYGA